MTRLRPLASQHARRLVAMLAVAVSAVLTVGAATASPTATSDTTLPTLSPPTTTTTTAPTTTTTTPPSVEGRRVLVVGDSLVVDAEDAIRAALVDAGAEVEIVAAGGVTIGWIGARIGEADARDVVVVAGGTNNAVSGWTEDDAVETFLTLFQLERHGCSLWILPSRWRHPGATGPLSHLDEGASQVVDALRADLATAGIDAHDWDAMADDADLHRPDGVHHSEAGAAAYAAFVSAAVLDSCG